MATKPSTYACVYNVKKRSWKGGIQVSIEITQRQIDRAVDSISFRRWLAEVLFGSIPADGTELAGRAHELFIQAVCRTKLDLLLQSGIAQENQCLIADTYSQELEETLPDKSAFITSYVASELDILSGDTSPS